MKCLLARQTRLQFRIQPRHPNFQNAIKLLLLRLDYFRHAPSRINQLRISPLHQVAHSVDHLKQKWLFLSQQPPMPNPTPQNLPQHIPAPFIRRQHAVIDEERSRPRMVCNDAQARVTDQSR